MMSQLRRVPGSSRKGSWLTLTMPACMIPRLKGLEPDAHDAATRGPRVDIGHCNAGKHGFLRSSSGDTNRRSELLSYQRLSDPPTFHSSEYVETPRQIAQRPMENKAEAATRNPRGLRFSHLNVNCGGHHFSSGRVPFHNLVPLPKRRLLGCGAASQKPKARPVLSREAMRGPGGLSWRRREANASAKMRKPSENAHPGTSHGRGPARVGLGWP